MDEIISQRPDQQLDGSNVDDAPWSRPHGSSMIRVGLRYATNLMSMVAQRHGYLAAGVTGARFFGAEAAKLPRYARLTIQGRARPQEHPTRYSAAIYESIANLNVLVHDFCIDIDAFDAHIQAAGYPRNYAAGPINEGGRRDQKLLEYFISLELLGIAKSDTVIDVASEHSMFPDVIRRLIGAKVFRQDLVYKEGIHGDEIGGSAAAMPISSGSVDKLVLHNSFEHFEGTADTEFIREADRVLRPGGRLCILPLFISDQYSIITDPLVSRAGVRWDQGAKIVQIPWWRSRFGRFYDAEAFNQRVLEPALQLGFEPAVYRIVNVKQVHQHANLHFALVLTKSV